ncbi:hypothetical protein GCK72_023607 [Caenorhabditis remanei]|uniref:Uncharacterized protein n=1 Tax=Caenorhabditis remanei TaxID=31234 RepID=A0A6A5FXA2_CAERE|nr:hypothetical protein GCK72_023607 [Caenorhabditis remanei]KAF1747147.1 hypothetical protein GCK72_023607 [Caenorhabditis remanei]
METSENTNPIEYNVVYIAIILLMALIGLGQTLFLAVATYKTRSRNCIPKFVLQLFLTNILNFLAYVTMIVLAMVDIELLMKFKKWIEFGVYYVTYVRILLPLALSVYHFTILYLPFEWIVVRKWLGAVLSILCWVLPCTTVSIFSTLCDFDDSNFRWIHGIELATDKCLVISIIVIIFRCILTFASFACDVITFLLIKDSPTMGEVRLIQERLVSMFGLVLFLELIANTIFENINRVHNYKVTPGITIGSMLVLYLYPMVFIVKNTKQRVWMEKKWRSWSKKPNIIMVTPATSTEPSAAK